MSENKGVPMKAQRDDENYNGMLVKVDRLLTVADDPTADGDVAAAAWKQAHDLMNEFAEEDYKLHEEGGFPIVQHRVELPPDPVMNGLKFLLAYTVALGNRCSAWYSYTATDDNPITDTIMFYGVENDCIRAERIWAGMEERRSSGWRNAARQYHKKADKKWRNGYYQGFMERIIDRYERMDNEWKQQGRRGSEDELEATRRTRLGANMIRLVRDANRDEFATENGLKKRSIEKENSLTWTVSRRAVCKGRKDADGVSLGLDEPQDPQTARD